MTGNFYTLSCLCAALLLLSLILSGPAHAACTTPVRTAGQIIYNSTAKVFQYCNGTDWVRMNQPGTGSGGCTNPAIAEGKIVYNEDARVLQGCAGATHQAMGPVGGEVMWKAISTGTNHVCGIRSDDTLWCWGSTNSDGRIGNGTTLRRSIPAPVSGGGTWKAVSAAMNHTCGIKTDDTLWCWGWNNSGRLGDGTTTTRTVPTAVSGGGTWKAVQTGRDYSCGIKTDDTLWCWGSNDDGRLGDGTTTQRLVPTAISGGGTWKIVGLSSYSQHTCAIKTDDTAWCWGINSEGQLGDGTATGSLVPVAVAGGYSWRKIESGDNHTCAIQIDDSAWCWGAGSSGQRGDGSTASPQTSPVAVSGGGTWADITVNSSDAPESSSCGLKSDGSAWCWGNGIFGQRGDGLMTSDQTIPVAVSGGDTWAAIDNGSRFACGITANGGISCWGSGIYAQRGDNVSSNWESPRPVSGGGSWSTIAAGNEHSCGVKMDGSAWCWGDGDSGQRGDNATTEIQETPVSVSGTGPWKTIVTGSAATHTCGLKSNDTAWCWGNGSDGQRGTGNTATVDVPGAVAGGHTWKSISLGENHSCAIKSDDTVWCWGAGGSGQRGDGSLSTPQTTPVTVSGGGTWKFISAGNGNGLSGSCGIKMDNSAWCWGNGTHGQRGDGSTVVQQTTPVAVSGGAQWVMISAGNHTCGIQADGTLWCWGRGDNGQRGDGTTTTTQTIPVAVSGGGTWKFVNVGSNHTCGIKSDHTLWCWGKGDRGQRGDGTETTIQSTPVQVAGGGKWKTVSAGTQHTCAVTINNEALCWGSGSNGETGLETIVSVPTSGTWCAKPKSVPGGLVYNTDANTLQYCDGVGWVGVSN